MCNIQQTTTKPASKCWFHRTVDETVAAAADDDATLIAVVNAVLLMYLQLLPVQCATRAAANTGGTR